MPRPIKRQGWVRQPKGRYGLRLAKMIVAVIDRQDGGYAWSFPGHRVRGFAGSLAKAKEAVELRLINFDRMKDGLPLLDCF